MKIQNICAAFLMLLAVNLGVSTNANARPLTFELDSHRFGKVTEKSWEGKYLLIGIGYTSCPDICPTTVIDLATAVNTLGDQSDKVVPIFISIDPNRDTPENIAMYVQYFDSKMVGLTGNDASIRNVARNMRATYGYTLEGKPIYPPLPARYEVFHSTYLYLYSPDRTLVDVFGYGEGGVNVGEKVKAYVTQ